MDKGDLLLVEILQLSQTNTFVVQFSCSWLNTKHFKIVEAIVWNKKNLSIKVIRFCECKEVNNGNDKCKMDPFESCAPLMSRTFQATYTTFHGPFVLFHTRSIPSQKSVLHLMNNLGIISFLRPNHGFVLTVAVAKHEIMQHYHWSFFKKAGFLQMTCWLLQHIRTLSLWRKNVPFKNETVHTFGLLK